MKVLIIGLTLFACCFASTGNSADASAVPEITTSNPELTNPPLVLLPPVLMRSLQFSAQLPWLTPPKIALDIVETRALIKAAAKKHGVPEAFIRSIVAAESNFDAAAISPKGAIGLMQLMPSTAQLFGADPAVPAQNVDAGARYLRVLIDKYRKYRDGLRRAIAAYNAGPGVVDRYRGVPPYRETRTYVARVLGYLKQFQRERA